MMLPLRWSTFTNKENEYSDWDMKIVNFSISMKVQRQKYPQM